MSGKRLSGGHLNRLNNLALAAGLVLGIAACGAAPEEAKKDGSQTDATDQDGDGGASGTASSTSTGSSTAAGSSTVTGTATGTGTGTQTDTGEVDARSFAVVANTSAGSVSGWAVDKQNLSAQLAVDVYLGNKMDAGGVKIASVTANRGIGSDGNHPGSHAFSFTIPAANCDGLEHAAWFYSGGAPLHATAETLRCYKETTDGQAFFEGTVRAKMNCTGGNCHASPFEYKRWYQSLISQGPNEGGKRDNNGLINRPATVNGTPHAGGNRCGSVLGSPCCEFQKWWRIEFGQVNGDTGAAITCN